jgi:hypothetical protein
LRGQLGDAGGREPPGSYRNDDGEHGRLPAGRETESSRVRLVPGLARVSAVVTPAQKARHAKALARFAACMRKHGVSGFPDPDSQGRFPFDSLSKLDPGTPLFRAAYKPCQPLLPTFGPQIRFG